MRRIALAIGVVLLAAACSSSPTTSGSASNSNGTNGSVNVTVPTPSGATLTFNWLGANSKIIMVYPGAGTDASDKVSNGTFKNGQKAAIVCKTYGRWVSSVPPEKKRRSNLWYEIRAGGKTFYATAVYGDVSGGPVQWCPGM